MKVIYKYPIEHGTVSMPKGARIVHAALQHITLTLWAEVDPDEKEFETHYFRTIPTGGTVPQADGHSCTHMVTFFDGPYVWHVYEVKQIENEPVLNEVVVGEWQLCPKCQGEGLTSQPFGSTTTSPFRVCPVCDGKRLLMKPVVNKPQQI